MTEERRELPSDVYELAEDLLRLQFRMLRLGVSLLPRQTRPHVAAALREGFEAARATRKHFAGIVESELDELAKRTGSPERSAPAATPPVETTSL